MHVKKGDSVVVLAGKDRGKTGQIIRAFPRIDRVLVEGINMKKVHRSPKKSGEKGEIIEKSFPVHVSNVRLSDKKPLPAETKEKSKKVAPSKS